MAKIIVVFHDSKLACDVTTAVFNDEASAKVALYQYGVRHSNADLIAYTIGEIWDGDDIWELGPIPRTELFDLARVVRLNEAGGLNE